MPSKLNPYISFKDNARQAMEFYHTVFGGKLTLNTFKESQASQDPNEDNLIMHAMLEADNDMTLMAADTPSSMEYRPGTNMSISLSGDNEAELTGYYAKAFGWWRDPPTLSKGTWGDAFGMFADKFGIVWLVNIAGQKV